VLEAGRHSTHLNIFYTAW